MGGRSCFILSGAFGHGLVYSVHCHVYRFKVYTDSIHVYSVDCHVYRYTVYTDSIQVYSVH